MFRLSSIAPLSWLSNLSLDIVASSTKLGHAVLRLYIHQLAKRNS
jgi:hypothetical protein